MGHIVADFIDTGILTADIIKTGILESKNGKSWLDMSTGEFNFGDKVKYENGKFEIIVESSDGGNTSLGDELNNMNNKIDSITHAPIVELTGEQAFLYENNFTGTPTPSTIKISARVENVENPTYQWYFRRSGETSWTTIDNNNYNYYNVSHNDSTIFNNSSVKNVTFKCSVGDVYDEFTIVKVSSGSNGTIGNDGIGITEIQEQYYLSDSQQTLIGGTWQTTAPTWVKGKYIWTRTQFTYSNGNVTTTSPICVTGKDGADGLNGGVSVENVDMFYYQSTSATSLQGGSWTTTAPTWVNGKYVWSKTITYLDNGTQIESNPVCITGERGQNGIDGINGTNGKDGISTYFFIRYSEFSDGSSMTSTPNAKTKYMGTATTTNNVAPTTPSSYTWTLVKGADGKNGEQGVAGANGSSSYLHIKYSNDGKTFTANNGEELGTWIGTYVDTNPTDSSVFSDYNWVRFVGEDGADAYTVLLSNENHTFPSTYEGNIENAITITTVAIAYKGKTSITPTIGTLPTVTGLSLSKSGNAVTIVANKGTSLADTGTFKIPVIVDGITFEKTFSWSKSKNGLSGTDGEDGYTIFLTNENFTFVADDTGNVTKAQTTTTNILAYKGSNSLAFTIGTLPTVNGLTLSKTTDTITIKANTGTSLADVGSFDIIINADGKSFTKKFSWSKTKTGASGSNAEYVTVTGEQVFKYTNNFSGTPTPSSITLTATKFNTNEVGKWQWLNGSTWTDWSSNTSTLNATTLSISPTSGSLNTGKSIRIRYIVGSVYDEITIIKVSDGAKGDTGATGSSGIGINSITEYYAISSSNTTAPTSWSTTVPTMTATNKYLWNYETITYSNNTTTNTSKRVIGVYGDKGNTGATGSTGATGNGISKIANYYLATSSSSGVTTSTSGWTTSVQSVSSSKKYLWNYEVITYTNGSTTTTTPCIIGAYGDTGDSAKAVSLTSSSQVFKSTDGGLTFTPDNIVITPNYQNVSYSKWQYSTNGGSSWTDVSSSTNGVTYSSTSLTLSKSSTLFTNKVTSIIFKIVTNNNSIIDTITIVKLYDVTDLKIGATNYLRQSSNYSSPYWNNKGATITNEYYMGSKVYKVDAQWGAMAYVKNKELELEPETEYILSAYIKKDSGIKYDSEAFMCWYGLSVNTVVVTLDNLTTSWKQYSVKRKGKEITANGDGAGVRIEPNKAITGGYIYVAGIQIEKGNKATDWKPNTNDLENAYTIVLTNEAQVIPTNSNRVPTSNATYTTDIQVYQGTTQRTDYTIGTINSANGITVSKTSSRVSFAVSTGTTITADGGNFTIPITIDSKTFNKTFSWSCSKQGATGNTGATGASGADAYTVILTNESHTFATQNNGNISSAISTTTQVLAYKGASSITPTIGTLPTVNGLTLSKSGTTITIQANTGTSLADSGSFNIPVTVDGKSFTKTFSWSKSKQGATGATGASGTNAKSVDIVASSQVFKSTDGGTTFTPSTITLSPILQNVTFSKWQYSTNGGSSWTNVSSGSNGLTVSGNDLKITNSSSLYTSTNTTVVFKVITSDSNIYDTMTVVKLYDVTDIEIGGRNYIRNGKGNMKAGFFKNFNDVTGTYGELTLTSQKTFSNISIADGFVLKCRDYEVGRKMVFSYDIMYTKWDFPSGTNRQEFWIGQRYTNSPTSTDGQWRGVTQHNLPVVGENGCKLNEWYHVSKIITIPQQAEATIGTASSIQFYNSNADVSASFTARFKNVKLEYGNVETDWTPSPEDVDYDINTAINPLIKTDEQLTKRLDNAFSDDIITAYEKIQIASDLKEIDAQYDDVTKTVKSYNDSSITGIYNEYKVAYDNLHTALDPCLESMDTDTKLSNSVVKDAFLLYGTYYSHLRSAIDDYIKNSFDTTKSSITSLSNSVDIAISKSSSNEQNLNTIAKHMKFSDEGWLELFATTNGNEGRFKTKITDTKLSFTDNNQEVAYMSNQKLYINYAQINNDLQIGSIVATKSDKGGIVFKWQ